MMKLWTEPSFGPVKLCVACRRKGRMTHEQSPTWKCRFCKARCCQHLCLDKDPEPGGEAATCGPCKRKHGERTRDKRGG